MQDSLPSPSRNLVHAENSTRTITFQILSRLPAKSLTRFQSVSKLWLYIIRSKDLADSFLARSKTQPRLLFTFKDLDSGKRFFFSAPELQNDEKSSTVIARHDMTISDLDYINITSPPVNGFVCFTRGSSVVVCNPTTKHMLTFPIVKSNGRDIYARLGYDPVDDEYKVLCVTMFHGCDGLHRRQEHLVFSLTSQYQRWRKIKIAGDPYTYLEGGICMDGAIYYGVEHTRIARFDVRTEKIAFIQGPEDYNAISCYSTLIKYQGKLACISYGESHEMRMWILHDVEKQEWSSIMTCGVPCNKEIISLCSGEVHTNEVVISSRCLDKFCVYYLDMTRESIVNRVEIEGMADNEFRRIHRIGKMLCFPGHVENISGSLFF